MTITYEILYKDNGDSGDARKQKLSILSKLIARTQFDGEDNKSIIQPWVWKPENQGYLEDLEKISANDREKSLNKMVKDGAFIVTAKDRSKVVGVVIVMQLPARFAECREELMPEVMETEGKKPTHKGDTEKRWLKKVENWALSDTRSNNLSVMTRKNIALLIQQYHYLWEISALGVEEGYRRQGIGSKLLEYAIYKVPSGGMIYLSAEPTQEKTYERIGFERTKIEGCKCEIYVPNLYGANYLVSFPVMTFQKP